MPDPQPWDSAVVYQVYVRSFQDTDGDGVGDLPGVTARLEYIRSLGVDAIWLSPIFPSPNVDFGYDVSEYCDVAPELGTLADFDALVSAAHRIGLRVLLDFVPCHTSTAHRWFREHPEYYVWAERPPNNWVAAFGGPAWALDPVTGRYYLHSFFEEQADLDWRRSDVRAEMAHALRFWLARGVDGFRLDALDRLLKDPQLRDDPQARGPAALPSNPADERLDHAHSRNAPDIGTALTAIREAVGDAFLVGEVYLPAAQLAPYLGALDAAFAFEALHAGGDAALLRNAIRSALAAGRTGWVLSNHDFSRLATRAGGGRAPALALLLLGLPGPAFMLAGDELGLPDGELADPPLDRFGRDRFRVPMLWDDSPSGGFTAGEPWLRVLRPGTASVARQEADPESQLALTRRLIAVKRALTGPAEVLESAPGTVVVARGEHVIAVNLDAVSRPVPPLGEILAQARPGDGSERGVLPGGGGLIARRV